ncbi:MAG: ABC transporter permease [Rhodobacteraceae bacterium]|uniref:ABC transporter permease n=1 Tax=Amaricoccus sp. TaxID=1872485 RepID=UPI001D2D76DC|nr:ABC transporter permease [Amaricoccus sp.]MCB1372699.1 ABC transporter permease [Paracoccaceae bacterium]MCB1402519.1 ABC transporter permease [Paracoccaceae bacterium]MCC0067467.1 ABC transporter permease [Rhodovulum sp.]HRW16573.1 ABC transporter permease [Amaricoccus sp.]
MTETVAIDRPSRHDLAGILNAAALPLAVVLLGLFFYIKAPVFLTPRNLLSITVQVASLMTIAVPFAILLMAGKVDLSVGSLLGLCGVVAGLSFPVLGVAGAVVFTLLVGLAAGLVNGFLVSWLSMSPIIVTLGGLTLMRGLAQYLSPNPLFGFPESFSYIGYGVLFGVPYLTWIMLAVLVAGFAFMRLSPFGRHAVAIGVNERAAYLVGIRVKLTVMLLYAAVGVAAALAGLMTVARINSAPSGTLGVGMELSVLTAVLLGGVPFTGGRGSLPRVALGVLLLGMLSNGLILMNVPTEASLMLTGLVLIVAAALDVLRSRRS